MSRRTTLLFGAGLLLLIAVQIAVLLDKTAFFGEEPVRSSIEIQAASAGIPYSPGDASVLVYPPGDRVRIRAEGGLFEALAVEPGHYDVRIALTASRDHPVVWLEDIVVEPGQPDVRSFEIPTGQLSVEVDLGSPSPELHTLVYVFQPGDRDHPITSMSGGEQILIGAGRYDLRIVLLEGARERATKWWKDVAVEAGLLTAHRISFERGSLLVVANNAGAPVPSESIEVAVFRAGDELRELVDRGTAERALNLPVGRYDVEATYLESDDQPTRWLRDLEVAEGHVTRAPLSFSSGKLILGATLGEGERLDGFRSYVYAYLPGDHEQAVAYVPAGEPLTLEGGRYDIRVSLQRSADQPHLWLRDLELAAGETLRKSIAFGSGSLLVRAFDEKGDELLGDNAFVHVHPPGQTATRLALARSGERLVLSAGTYDLRIEDTRGKGVSSWIKAVVVVAGESTEPSIKLGAGSR